MSGEEIASFSMLSIQDIDEGEICYSAKESNKENRSPYKEAHYFRSLQSQLDSMPVPNKDLAETPEWMSVQLLPYQQYGLNWMKWREETSTGGILADEMGLGKTTPAISLITSFLIALQNKKFLKIAKENQKRLVNKAIQDSGRKMTGTFSTLVVVPGSVLNQWQQELKDKVNEDHPLKIYCHTGPKKSRDNLDDKVLRQADVVLTTYEILRNDVIRKSQGNKLVFNEHAAIRKVFWKRVILDEAHTIKNLATQINSAVMDIEADCRWALTGTPVHFYALVRFLRIMPFADPGFWEEKMSDETPATQNRLDTLIGTILLLHHDKPILRLPDRTNYIHRVHLEGDESKAYDLMLLASQQKVKQLLDEKSGHFPRSTRSQDVPDVFERALQEKIGKMMMHVILVVLLQLQQTAIHFCLAKEALSMDAFDGVLGPLNETEAKDIDGDISLIKDENKYTIFDASVRSKKLQKVMALINDIVKKGDNVVVVSQFVSVLRLLAVYLNEDNIRYLIFDGSLNGDKKGEVINAFVMQEQVPVLLLSLTSGGTGLNIQTCANMIIVEPHWNLQLEEQACSQIHCHGQKQAVQIHKFYCEGTIEERVVQLRENKLKLVSGILSGRTEKGNTLTLDDLHFLFSMDKIMPAKKKKATGTSEIMENFKKKQLNHMPTSSVNRILLEALPDVVFYAVMEKLPARVIENTVRQLSRDCYRRVELHRARLPRVYIDKLYVDGNWFRLFISDRADDRLQYAERIDPANLTQHLDNLKERATFNTLELRNVNWEMFANCKFKCEELSCFVSGTTLSPERFMDIFRSIRPTRKLVVSAYGDNQTFPVTRDFFTNNYAIGLQEVGLIGHGNAMIDPLNDTILLDSIPLIFYSHFQTNFGCTLDGILTMIRGWYTSERQIDKIGLRAVGGEAERQNFLHSLSGLQDVKLLSDEGYCPVRALKRANGDVVELRVCCNRISHIKISMVRLVPGPEADLYRRYYDVG